MRTIHFHHQEKNTTFSGHAPKRPQIGTQMGDQITQNSKKAVDTCSSRKTNIAHSRTETKHFKFQMLRFRCRVGAIAIAVQTEKQLKGAEN